MTTPQELSEDEGPPPLVSSDSSDHEHPGIEGIPASYDYDSTSESEDDGSPVRFGDFHDHEIVIDRRDWPAFRLDEPRQEETLQHLQGLGYGAYVIPGHEVHLFPPQPFPRGHHGPF